jgi:hypothetical protein
MRGRDVVEQGGIWALRITPEAGSTKNRKPRSVPLHEHVAALGFLDFVESRGSGPLFFDGDDKDRPLEIVKNIGRWVRSIGVTDPEFTTEPFVALYVEDHGKACRHRRDRP